MAVSAINDLLAALDGHPPDRTRGIGKAESFATDFDTTPADLWPDRLAELLDRVGGWHTRLTTGGAELVRHGLAHLTRGDGPLPERLGRCCTPTGPYFVPGVGWRFWATVAHGTEPDRLPHWCPALLAGCARLGGAAGRAADDLPSSFSAVAATYDAIRRLRPHISSGQLDRFFRAVGRGVGREPGDGDPDLASRDQVIRHELRAVRAMTPLKRRTTRSADATESDDLLPSVAAIAGESPVVPASATGWTEVVSAVTDPDDLVRALADNAWLAGDGLWLAAGVLHRRHPRRFPPWSAAVAAGQAALDDAVVSGLSNLDRYRLLVGLAAELRQRFRVHPAEVGDLLARLGTRLAAQHRPSGRFGGFSSDTFRFLGELADHNTASWMAAARGRYRYAVRGPLVELCQALAERYVGPVLAGEYGWELETDPRPGKAISSVCKNDFGQSAPYQPVLWATFYRKPGHKRAAAQLFVRLAADGLSAGFRLARTARADGRRFRANVQAHGPLLFEALAATGGATAGFTADHERPGRPLRSAADLREWATHKDLVAAVRLAPADAVSRTEELVGDALLTFDRLVPLFAAAVEDDPVPVVSRRAGRPAGGPGFDRAAFRDATLLGEPWLDRALALLHAKRQLVLQGAPGTGKTHVARCLARHLTGDRADLLATVQFHPAYSYEEFVEGIRPNADGGAVTYPVEPGLLCRFAERAARHPADPHVLLIDEVNRGNLPRVFGELLYLLEYRDQEVLLPYSKAPFRLPANLYLLATLNPADRSVTALDQATRRRFAFLDMPPDAAVLGRWLVRHPPADPDPEFGGRLVRWFESLNRRLARDYGPDRQIGHAYWLRDEIDRDLVRIIWEHEVRPSLADLFAGSPQRLDALGLDRAVADPPPPPPVRRRPTRSVVR